MADAAALEALSWQAVNNQLAQDIMFAAVVGTEQRCRTDLQVQAAEAFATIVSRHARNMSFLAAAAVHDANRAATEALQWLEIADSLVPMEALQSNSEAQKRTASPVATSPQHEKKAPSLVHRQVETDAMPTVVMPTAQQQQQASSPPRVEIKEVVKEVVKEVPVEVVRDPRAESLWKALTGRYGPEPTQQQRAANFQRSAAATGDGTRARLIRFFELHDPSRLAKVDDILARYEGPVPDQPLWDLLDGTSEEKRVAEGKHDIDRAREALEQARTQAQIEARAAAEKVRAAQQVEHETQQRRTELEQVEAQIKGLMHDQESEAAEARRRVAALTEDQTALQRRIQALTQEQQEVQRALEARREASLAERQQLEADLETLRHEVEKERLLLQQAKVDNEAAQQQQQHSPRGGLGTPQHQQQHQQQQGVTPSLASGLAALTDVREQIRDMRHGSGGAGGVTTSTTAYSSPYQQQQQMASDGDDAGIRRSQTQVIPPMHAAYSSPRGQQQERVLSSDNLRPSPSSSAFSAARSPGAGGPNGVSPWKARLQKLQGELKSLRSELGSTTA